MQARSRFVAAVRTQLAKVLNKMVFGRISAAVKQRNFRSRLSKMSKTNFFRKTSAEVNAGRSASCPRKKAAAKTTAQSSQEGTTTRSPPAGAMEADDKMMADSAVAPGGTPAQDAEQLTSGSSIADGMEGDKNPLGEAPGGDQHPFGVESPYDDDISTSYVDRKFLAARCPINSDPNAGGGATASADDITPPVDVADDVIPPVDVDDRFAGTLGGNRDPSRVMPPDVIDVSTSGVGEVVGEVWHTSPVTANIDADADTAGESAASDADSAASAYDTHEMTRGSLGDGAANDAGAAGVAGATGAVDVAGVSGDDNAGAGASEQQARADVDDGEVLVVYRTLADSFRC